ncbi:hypothetical protein Tco_0298571 [Tanacetum coccineum]
MRKELAALHRAQQERQRQEDDTNAALAKEFDEIQAIIDADHELAVRLTHEEQEKYIIEERARLLAEFFDQRKKQLAAARAEAIRNNYLQKLTIKDSEKNVDSSSKLARGSRKKTLTRKRVAKSDEEAVADYEHEKEELRMWLTIVSDEKETVDLKILQDLVDLHRLVMKRFEDTTPEGYNLLLWGDLKVMFEPNAEDEIWIEKRYPLIKEMLQKMLNWKLKAEAESTMAFELLKFIKSQLEE